MFLDIPIWGFPLRAMWISKSSRGLVWIWERQAIISITVLGNNKGRTNKEQIIFFKKNLSSAWFCERIEFRETFSIVILSKSGKSAAP